MDLKSLTYRQKNVYLLWGTLVFALLAYFLAVSNTISLWQQNKDLKQQLAKAEQAPVQIRSLQTQLDNFNSHLGSYLVEDNDNQEKMVRIANEFCQKNQLILREIPESSVQQENDFEIITTQIVAQGTFANLVKMVYFFEQQNKIGRVTSVRFEKTEDFKTRKTYLAVRILLQNLRIDKK